MTFFWHLLWFERACCNLPDQFPVQQAFVISTVLYGNACQMSKVTCKCCPGNHAPFPTSEEESSHYYLFLNETEVYILFSFIWILFSWNSHEFSRKKKWEKHTILWNLLLRVCLQKRNSFKTQYSPLHFFKIENCIHLCNAAWTPLVG